MIAKRRGEHAGMVLISFDLPTVLWADQIHLVGDFNAWDPHSLPMSESETSWHIELELPRGRAYRFRYLVDDQNWFVDPQADGFASGNHGCDALLQT